MRLLSALTLVATCFSAAPLSSEHWISLKTPQVEMYSTKAQAQATQELDYLETLSSFFAAVKPFGNGRTLPAVQVITFRTSGEFAPYAFRSEGGGYYVHTYKSDYILIGDSGPREHVLMGHEFTHMVVTQAGLKLPIWLNEGVADFYSTVEINGKQATLGHAPTRYLETVHHQQWIPWEALFAVDGSSQVYNESGKLAILYSQSWALTHMLKLDGRYAPHFEQFLLAISDGQGSKEAFQSVYHKSVAEMDSDLSSYIRGKTLPTSVMDYTQPAASPIALVTKASDFEVQLALANVLASKPATSAEGLSKLAELATRFPNRPEPEEEMGMAALQQNQNDLARSHLGVAVQHGSKDATVLYNDAVLEKEAGAKYGPVSDLLRRALEMQPSLEPARMELGFVEYQHLDYKSSLSLLLSLTAIPNESLFDVNFTIAQCYVNVDQEVKAKPYVRKAAKAARTDDQKRDAAELLENVMRDEGSEVAADGTITATTDTAPKPEAPLTNVRGVAKVLRCSSGQKQLGVEVNGKQMFFDIGDPALVARHAVADYAHWSCGPLKAITLTVVYRPQSDPSGTSQVTDGKAIELLF